MGRKKIWAIAAAIVAVCLIGAAVLLWKQHDEEGIPIEAMYVTYGESDYLMVEQEDQTVFTVHMPEKIYGRDGARITQAELEKGNILTIYGDGIMLETYPGQYPGVSKIEVKEKGTPSDADQYQGIRDKICSEPNPAEPPRMQLEYYEKQVASAAMVTRFGYKWSYTDENGETQATVADTVHVMASENLTQVRSDSPLDVRLLFSQDPKSVEVVRWSSKLRGSQENIGSLPEGENVLVENGGSSPVLKNVEAGYVYLITAKWENGTVEYGFYTE